MKQSQAAAGRVYRAEVWSDATDTMLGRLGAVLIVGLGALALRANGEAAPCASVLKVGKFRRGEAESAVIKRCEEDAASSTVATTAAPTSAPTAAPTATPTAAPTAVTAAPTSAPTKAPAAAPTSAPTITMPPECSLTCETVYFPSSGFGEWEQGNYYAPAKTKNHYCINPPRCVLTSNGDCNSLPDYVPGEQIEQGQYVFCSVNKYSQGYVV